jgi:polyisoprenoid-binding protein YceI
MALPIGAGTYAIDTVHSQLGFRIGLLDISLIQGTFDRFGGALSVGESLADTAVTIEAETASLNTGNERRDHSAHAADFLDVARFPTLRFRSASIVEDGTRYAMQGDLTFRGATLPVTFDVSFNGSAFFPLDKCMHFGFSASTSISRSAFGMSYGVPLLSDRVELRAEVQFVQPPADA